MMSQSVPVIVLPAGEDLPVFPTHSLAVRVDSSAALEWDAGLNPRPLPVLPTVDFFRVALKLRCHVVTLDAGKGESRHCTRISGLLAHARKQLHDGTHIYLHH